MWVGLSHECSVTGNISLCAYLLPDMLLCVAVNKSQPSICGHVIQSSYNATKSDIVKQAAGKMFDK